MYIVIRILFALPSTIHNEAPILVHIFTQHYEEIMSITPLSTIKRTTTIPQPYMMGPDIHGIYIEETEDGHKRLVIDREELVQSQHWFGNLVEVFATLVLKEKPTLIDQYKTGFELFIRKQIDDVSKSDPQKFEQYLHHPNYWFRAGAAFGFEGFLELLSQYLEQKPNGIASLFAREKPEVEIKDYQSTASVPIYKNVRFEDALFRKAIQLITTAKEDDIPGYANRDLIVKVQKLLQRDADEEEGIRKAVEESRGRRESEWKSTGIAHPKYGDVGNLSSSSITPGDMLAIEYTQALHHFTSITNFKHSDWQWNLVFSLLGGEQGILAVAQEVAHDNNFILDESRTQKVVHEFIQAVKQSLVEEPSGSLNQNDRRLPYSLYAIKDPDTAHLFAVTCCLT